MLLDKEFLFDFVATHMNVAAPVQQIAASYETTNHPDDVAKIRSLFEENGIEEDFYFFTSCSRRVKKMCGEYYQAGGSMAAMSTTVNGVHLIAFDMAVLRFSMENDLSFKEVMEHELVHLRQLESGRLSFEDSGALWHNGDILVSYPRECMEIMDPLMFDRSMAFQMALPWEAEAYAAEVARFSSTQRGYAINLGHELSRPARMAMESGNRALIDLVRWTELAMTLMIFKYKDYNTAEEQLGYVDLDDNVHVRTNQMREIVKSLMCATESEFDEYCRRSR